MENTFNLDLSQIPAETRLLLKMLKKESFTDEMLVSDNEGLFTDIDWDFFLQLAKHHRVYPTLYKKIKKVNAETVPSYVVQGLFMDFQQNTFRMLHLSGETEQISKLFSQNQVRSLFLKGPFLGDDLYGDISLRTSGDLDILIPIYDLEKVEALLFKEGYVKDDYIRTVLKDWKWRHHHVAYFHPGKKVKLEIHWRLNPGPAKEPCFDELWERKRISSHINNTVHYLGKEDLFLFLACHGARHGWSRLRWLVDIQRLMQQKLDWTEVWKLLRNYQCSHIGGQALILASQLLDTRITKKMAPLTTGTRPRTLAQDTLFYIRQMVSLHTDPVSKDIARYHKRHLFSLMSRRQRAIFILSFLYPYPKDAETLPLPKGLHFLYFLFRPFLLIWRKTRKQGNALGGYQK